MQPRNRTETISAADIAPIGYQIRDLSRKTSESGRRFYYTARVLINGESYDVHSIFGAWHVSDGHGGIQELEAVLGDNVGRSVKFDLAQRAGSVERRINDSMESARKGRVR